MIHKLTIFHNTTDTSENSICNWDCIYAKKVEFISDTSVKTHTIVIAFNSNSELYPGKK